MIDNVIVIIYKLGFVNHKVAGINGLKIYLIRILDFLTLRR